MKSYLNIRRCVLNFGIIFSLILSSCATAPNLQQPKRSKQKLEQLTKPVAILKPEVSSAEIRQKIKKFKKVLAKKKLSKNDWTGRDFLNGDSLSVADRVLSGIGVITGSGASYRYAKRVINSPPEYLDDFSKGLGQASGKKVNLDYSGLAVSESSLDQSIRETESFKNNFGNLKEALQLLKENNISRDERKRIVGAFTPTSKTKITSEDVDVYRYYVTGKSSDRGNWVTREKTLNPEVDLALP